MTTMTSQVFTTTDLAARLGVSANMARRYGITWEKVTGETLPQVPGSRPDVLTELHERHGGRALLVAGAPESQRRGCPPQPPSVLTLVEASPATADAMEVSGALREALAQVLEGVPGAGAPGPRGNAL